MSFGRPRLHKRVFEGRRGGVNNNTSIFLTTTENILIDKVYMKLVVCHFFDSFNPQILKYSRPVGH